MLRFLAVVMLTPAAWASGEFLVDPYLQMGNNPSDATRLTILWHAADADGDWAVEHREGRGEWKKTAKPEARRVAMVSITPHRVYHAEVSGLAAGKAFEYRILLSGRTVFSSHAMARKSEGQAYRFDVMGDIAQGTPQQKLVSIAVAKSKPDFVFVPGDIVYGRGRISEYREKYFPIYNAAEPKADTGAPLIRSTMFVAAPGNHDVATTDMEKYPDAQAYFYYWSQPLNGPALKPGGAHMAKLTGPAENIQALLEAAKAEYPRMANFSFDYGNAHWTVLDSNPFVDWTKPELREWLKADLASAAARKATWRFVGFHHPGFNSSATHFKEQQMRVISDLLEEGAVDLVFAGHVHNYQRTFPLRFSTAIKQWTLDNDFNGSTKTRPKGVIYLVTGAGGAKLYNPEQHDKPESWQPFTDKFVSKVNSFTQVDVKGRRLVLRQISATGAELDRAVVTKE